MPTTMPAPATNSAPLAPAFLARRTTPMIGGAMAQGLGVASHPRISTRMNRFSLVNAAGQATLLPVLYLDVVIVGANQNVSKVFYDAEFDQNATDYAPPDCFSDNGVGPSDRAARPQAPVCSTCPMNVWGSDTSRVSGKPTKACNDVKKLAVICHADGSNTVYELRVSPATLKHLRAYAEFLAKQSLGDRAVDAGDVITRLQFDPQTQGVLNFSAVGWIDENTYFAMEQIELAGTAKQVVGLNDKPRDINLQLPPPAAAPLPLAAVAPPPPLAPPPAPPPAAPGALFTAPPAAQPPAAAPAAAPPPPAAGTPPAAAAPAAPRRRGRPAAAAAQPPAQPPAAPPPVAPGAPAPSHSMFAAAAPVGGPGMPAPAAPPAAAYPAPPADPARALEVPAFLQRQPAAGAPPPPPAATFGVAGGVPASSPELDAALQAAFSTAAPPATA